MINITNEDNMSLMERYPDNYFDLAIVDPPYGLGDSVVNSGGKFKTYNNINGNWDKQIPNDNYFNELFRVSKNQIIWGGNYFHKVNLSGIIIWNKGKNGSMKEGELAKTSFNTFKHFDCTRIDAYVNSGENKIHPTQKPTALYKFCLEHYAKEGDEILDTHLGSGSIAIACHDYKYNLTACELDKEYFYKAMERINNHVAQQKLF
jgi:site-specific DNA-methyltransferase (adenine-specific)